MQITSILPASFVIVPMNLGAPDSLLRPGKARRLRVTVLERLTSKPRSSLLRLHARSFGRTVFHRPVNFTVRARSEKLLAISDGLFAVGTCESGAELLSIIRLQFESDLHFLRVGSKRVDLICLLQMFPSLRSISLDHERSPEIVMCRCIAWVRLQNCFPFRDCLVDLSLRSKI
jgi:hypothetical protein